jgi:phosphoglycolate phosphatase-like HAD superfamily hydrolase
LTPEEVVALFGPTEEGILARMVPDAPDAAMETYVAAYRAGHDTSVEFAGVTDIVHRLADAGIPQAVVTGKGPRTADVTIRALGLDGILDPVIPGSENGSIKADAIASVARSWGLPPATIVYLGDIPSDVTHARTAGAVPVSVAWKADADRDALAAQEPALVVETPGELRAWLGPAVGVDL